MTINPASTAAFAAAPLLLAPPAPATTDALAHAARIYSDHSATSLCNFAVEHRKQLRPRRILNRLGQARPRETLHVQIFYGNQAVGQRQPGRKFVRLVASLIRNVFVRLGNLTHGMAPALRITLAPRDPTLTMRADPSRGMCCTAHHVTLAAPTRLTPRVSDHTCCHCS